MENGARRIGHGIRAVEDESLIQLLIDRHVTLEVCPTSNIQTGAVVDIAAHPIRRLYEAGVHVTVNTDDMIVCDTKAYKEYRLLHEAFGWDCQDFKRMNIYAAEGAFISSMEKERLRALIVEKYK